MYNKISNFPKVTNNMSIIPSKCVQYGMINRLGPIYYATTFVNQELGETQFILLHALQG